MAAGGRGEELRRGCHEPPDCPAARVRDSGRLVVGDARVPAGVSGVGLHRRQVDRRSQGPGRRHRQQQSVGLGGRHGADVDRRRSHLPLQSEQDPARGRGGRSAVRPAVLRAGATPGWQGTGWNEAAQAASAHRPPEGLGPAGHPSPAPVAPPAGWSLDPEHGYQRWWDGTKWTEHRTPSGDPPGT